MLALGACFDTGKLMGNRVVDGLIIANLEMQKRVMFDRAPIAPVQAIATDDVQRARDVGSIALGHDEQAGLRHRLPKQREKLAIEIRPAPLAIARVRIELKEGIPMRFRDAGP